MEPYRLHHPGVHAYERMDMHLPYERMRMQQHRMYHHAPPPALYPQFRQSPMEPLPQFEPRQQQIESPGDSEMMTSTTVEGKKRLIIFPRRKAGQRERDINNVAPVHLTLETIEEIADVPLLVAAKQLGISKTALKNACRHLGLERWPFRRRMQNARLQSKAAEKAASQIREAAAAATAADARAGTTNCSAAQRPSQTPSNLQGQRAQRVKKEEASTSDSSFDGASRSSGSCSRRDGNRPFKPSERSSSAELGQDEDRLGAFYSALTTPNGSNATSGDDQASPTNLRPLRRNPAGPRFDVVAEQASRSRAAPGPRCAPKQQQQQQQQQQQMHLQIQLQQQAAARAAKEEQIRLEKEEDWIDARVRGASPHLHGDVKFHSSPLLSANIADEALHVPSQFSLKLPHQYEASAPSHFSSHQVERGMNNAVDSSAVATRPEKEMERPSAGLSSAELNWVMEEEQNMWGDYPECGYSLPVMYQPIGN